MHRTLLVAYAHNIRIAGNHVGTLLSGAIENPCELVVWDWRTGDCKLVSSTDSTMDAPGVLTKLPVRQGVSILVFHLSQLTVYLVGRVR